MSCCEWDNKNEVVPSFIQLHKLITIPNPNNLFLVKEKHANRLLSSDDTVVESFRLNIVLSVLMVL